MPKSDNLNLSYSLFSIKLDGLISPYDIPISSIIINVLVISHKIPINYPNGYLPLTLIKSDIEHSPDSIIITNDLFKPNPSNSLSSS